MPAPFFTAKENWLFDKSCVPKKEKTEPKHKRYQAGGPDIFPGPIPKTPTPFLASFN